MRTIIISGEAGSGKDTVGSYIADKFGGVCIGQADPLKRFAQDVFGFSYEQLWGPSERRNARDPRFDETDFRSMTLLLDSVENNFIAHAEKWIADVLPALERKERINAHKALRAWFDGVLEKIGTFQGLTPRFVLQTLGTEWGRGFSADMWIDYALRAASTLLAGGHYYERSEGVQKCTGKEGTCHDVYLVIITDGRFRNEIARVRQRRGVAFRILRAVCCGGAAAQTAGVQGHLSETEIGGVPLSEFDGLLTNDGTLEDLYAKVDALISTFYPEVPNA